jgi:hypothetical protein
MASTCGVKARKQHGGNRHTLKRAYRMAKAKNKTKTFLDNIMNPEQYQAHKKAMKAARSRRK